MAKRKAAHAPRKRSVLIIGSEALPFSKTGGLADVLGALPSALARLGWDATVALPRYRGVSDGVLVDTFPITVGGFTREVAFYEAPLPDGARALLIGCPDLYDRDGLYGAGGADYADNARRFGMLSRAALEYVARRDALPDLVHAHDWQAGLVPVYLKTLYATHPVLASMPSVFTIHNLAYQGLFEPDWLPRLDLPWSLFSLEQLEYWGRMSFLKGGIQAADLITTVSPRYAQEIQTLEFGSGFDGILRQRAGDLVGILNGINTTVWDPARDPFLPAPFDAENLAGKAEAKAAVLAQYGLPADARAMARPLVGMISRLVDQKGLDLIGALADTLPRLEATFVVLGTGEARYQNLWTRLAAAHPDRVGAHIGFNEALAHLIEAGADMFLMPSRFEPCGLNQMYSLRYGTVPIVRAVGGLADTVIDAGTTKPVSPPAAPKRSEGGKRGEAKKPREGGPVSPKPRGADGRGEGGNGFIFRDYTPEALLKALQRALAAFADSTRWRAIQRAGMAEDHSWDRSAQEYVKIYERAINKGRSRTVSSSS